MKKYLFLALLAAVLLFGLYLRIVGVLTNSFAFTYDVGRDMLQVQQIVVAHKIPLIGQTTGLGGLFYGPWWYYILTPSFIASNGNPQGVAFFMVFLGLTSILLGYMLGVTISGKKLGIVIAVFTAVSRVMVGFSVQIWNPNIAPLLVMLLFICFFLQQKSNKRRIFLGVVMGLLLGLILDSEIVFGVLFISGFILVLLFLMKKKIISLSSLGIMVGFFIIMLPRIFFELRHNFVMTRSLFMPHASSQQIFNLKDFFIVLPDRIIAFLIQIADTFGLSNPLLAFLLVVLVIFVFAAFRKKMKKEEGLLVASSLVILGTFLVGSAVFARALWGHYLVGLPVLYIFIMSMALILVCRKNAKIGITLCIMMFVLSANPNQIIGALKNPSWEGNAAVYRNQVAVIDYVYKQADGKNFNEIVYTPVLHDYTYQYLFSWYGKNKYRYVPDTKKQKLFYVIIEPDPGYEGRIKDWLKIREGDGKVINESLVKGGILVQTRIR